MTQRVGRRRACAPVSRGNRVTRPSDNRGYCSLRQTLLWIWLMRTIEEWTPYIRDTHMQKFPEFIKHSEG
ncbi:hypothetical protein CEXT_744531 [Caerostris extrusa]|uniref:Uncharacterized protein n=1 Tax=Caerostris extrusa TaxID=172846 RepID=A0AAV4MK21_CAEEX|nr:hypothetical protein CEXT_744531 [Caerostris extrusa]